MYSFTDFGFAFLYVVPSPAVLSCPLTSPVQHMNAFRLWIRLPGASVPRSDPASSVCRHFPLVSSGFEVLSTHTGGRTWLESAMCIMHVLELFSSTKEAIFRKHCSSNLFEDGKGNLSPFLKHEIIFAQSELEATGRWRCSPNNT